MSLSEASWWNDTSITCCDSGESVANDSQCVCVSADHVCVYFCAVFD